MSDENTKKQIVTAELDEIDVDIQMDAENQKYEDAVKEIEEEQKIREERKKELMDRIRKEREKTKKTEEDGEIGAQEVINGKVINGRKKKIYSCGEATVFRHNKLNSFSTKGVKKLNKTLSKVHGIDVKKKVAFLKAIQAFNPSKGTLTKKTFDKFARTFRSKNYRGKNYKKIAEAGIDIKEMRHDFSKRDIDKLRRGITGEEDKFAYKSKSSEMRKSNSSSPTRSTRSH